MTKNKFNPDYLCGLPACEANTRGIIEEYQATIKEQAEKIDVQEDRNRLLESDCKVFSACERKHQATNAKLQAVVDAARKIIARYECGFEPSEIDYSVYQKALAALDNETKEEG